MRLRVLGSAAGGGVPQWNCGCSNCNEARSPTGRVAPRTQDGLALEVEPGTWFLIHCSPDIHRQIRATPALEPSSHRKTPIAGVVLTNGDLDHVLGLFSLRENTPLALYATAPVRRGLVSGNTMFRTLQRFPGQTTWHDLELGAAASLSSQVSIMAFALPGKVPKHLEGLEPSTPEDNIGLRIEDARTGRRAVIATAAGALGTWTRELEGADVCLLDGTFWSSDELPRLGLGTARAEDMAHLPIGGAEGSLAALASLPGVTAKRRIFTHINNTNPILVTDSPERAAVLAAGWEIAEDGMEIEL